MDLNIFLIVYITVIGLIIGSFLNVLIYRIPLKLSSIKGYSFCPKCNHRLNWIDLFPLFSWIFLGAKCRYCKAKISFRYPLVEVLNSLCYLAVYLKFGLSIQTAIYLIVLSSLITLAFIDIDHFIIPDRFHIIILVSAIILAIFTRELSIIERIIGLFAVSLPIYIIALITGGMGEGDVKLFAALGFLLGWKLILTTMLFASISAAIIGITLMALKKANKKTEIPFGPYIVLGSIISLFFGNELINLYLSFILK